MDFTTLAYALLSGILPALLWLWFWLKEDNLHPEPRFQVFLTFLSGCLVVILAIFIEKYIADINISENIKYVLWAGTEEIVKFLAVLIVALNSKNMDEPIDAMIYCITVALGFAAIENTFFILSPLNTGDIAKSVITGNMRFIGATLVHIVSSASIGFMVGISYYKSDFIKAISIIIGVILAIALHSTFNLSIINSSGTDTLKIFGLVWCAVVILIILFEEVKVIKPKTT